MLMEVQWAGGLRVAVRAVVEARWRNRRRKGAAHASKPITRPRESLDGRGVEILLPDCDCIIPHETTRKGDLNIGRRVNRNDGFAKLFWETGQNRAGFIRFYAAASRAMSVCPPRTFDPGVRRPGLSHRPA